MEGVEVNLDGEDNNNRSSYRDAAMGFKGEVHKFREVDPEDGAISNDDVVEESSDPSWFGIGMMREEKWRARQPLWNNLIIKLVGRSIGYHYFSVGSRLCGG